jgi:hypothetical protein
MAWPNELLKGSELFIVPKSCILPLAQTKACHPPSSTIGPEEPTTFPRLLIPLASVEVPPGLPVLSTPRSVIVYLAANVDTPCPYPVCEISTLKRPNAAVRSILLG